MAILTDAFKFEQLIKLSMKLVLIVHSWIIGKLEKQMFEQSRVPFLKKIYSFGLPDTSSIHALNLPIGTKGI